MLTSPHIEFRSFFIQPECIVKKVKIKKRKTVEQNRGGLQKNITRDLLHL